MTPGARLPAFFFSARRSARATRRYTMFRFLDLIDMDATDVARVR
jgi:hypothetical protein